MVSVCMATYNGEKFIAEQIDSVLQNLTDMDELVISDDGSNDRTVDIVKKYLDIDNRIKFLYGPGKGVIANFENAIIKSGGDLTAAAHTKEDLLVNAYVYSLNIVGSSTTNVYNTITNNA